ncbi:flagellar basal body-associated FliL family protein [Tissierella sp.]|uniref:flagellar basal body-associated FliL family protein n=1 Tax=Tissierella sp. TaxID=41274 RepID=UPI0030D7DBC7
MTLEDLYCNIKDSKRILKIKITLETINEDTLTTLTEKQFLIRDDVNKIITNLTEEELRGKEGQINLQNQIKTNMVELFNDESIINVYFNDFIIQ